MIRALQETEKQAVLRIAIAIQPIDEAAIKPLYSEMSHRVLEQGQLVESMGQQGGKEYFVLSGILRTYVLSPEGDEVTLQFLVAPCVAPPSITRTVNQISQVSCDALANSTLVEFKPEDLIQKMMLDSAIQRWGDAVLRAELIRRTQREMSLATKTAVQRLAEFRLAYPELESSVPHQMIASYLGITPVSLSRLRSSRG